MLNWDIRKQEESLYIVPILTIISVIVYIHWEVNNNISTNLLEPSSTSILQSQATFQWTHSTTSERNDENRWIKIASRRWRRRVIETIKIYLQKPRTMTIAVAIADETTIIAVAMSLLLSPLVSGLVVRQHGEYGTKLL